jgi:hypothetical protein
MNYSGYENNDKGPPTTRETPYAIKKSTIPPASGNRVCRVYIPHKEDPYGVLRTKYVTTG